MTAYRNNFLVELDDAQETAGASASFEPVMIEGELVRLNDGDVLVAEVDYNAA